MNRPEFTHEDIVNIVKKAGDKAREGRNETKSEKTIHDDFRKKVLHFRQNRSWDLEGSPEIKTVFSFVTVCCL